MLGLTQHQMAELIGVTYQQAHKYETAINRISAGRLYQIAQALDVEVGAGTFHPATALRALGREVPIMLSMTITEQGTPACRVAFAHWFAIDARLSWLRRVACDWGAFLWRIACARCLCF